MNEACQLALLQGQGIILAVTQEKLEGHDSAYTFWAFRPNGVRLAFGLPLLGYTLEHLGSNLWAHRSLGPNTLCWEEPTRETGSSGHQISMIMKTEEQLGDSPFSLRMEAMELDLPYGERAALFDGHGTYNEMRAKQPTQGRCTMIILPCETSDPIARLMGRTYIRIALRNLKATVTPATVLAK